MRDQEEGTISGDPKKAENPMEVQIGGRHLTLAVAGLALFGLVLFLLGRWSERMARPQEAMPTETVAATPPAAGNSAPDPAAAPKDLTFYETLGKKATPGLQETRKPDPPRREPPAELPAAATPQPPPPAAKVTRPEAATEEAPAAKERYRVQVASTRDLASARLLVDRLRKKGYAASIDTAQGPEGQAQYKVRIGNYPDRAPAEKVAEKVREEEKVGAWIVKVQG